MLNIETRQADRNDLQKSGLFDAEWYKASYPDVVELGIDPASHFLWLGDRLNRSPGPLFDTEAYRRKHQDVARTGYNAVLHYLRFGRKEGRAAFAVKADGLQTLAQTGPRRLSGLMSRQPGRPTVMLCAHVVGDKLYGGERSLIDMIEGVFALGCNIVVAVPTLRNPAYIDQIRLRACAVIELPYKWWVEATPVNEALVGTIARTLADEGIDVVYANTIMLREPLIAARRMGVAAVIHTRELIRHDAELQKLIGLSPTQIARKVWDNCDLLIANSQATAASFDRGKNRSAVVYNTADIDALAALPLPSPTGTLRVGMIGSNIPKKGIEDFTAVARLVAKKRKDVEFLLIGQTNPHTDAIQAEINAGKLPRSIRIAGYRNSPAEAVAECHVVLSLSQFQESFGRTVLEAMAGARPVVVYDHGAPPELVVEGVTGHVVGFRDTGAVAERICALAADRTQMLLLGVAARDHARARFGKAAYARALGRALEPVLTMRPKPRPMTLPARSIPARIARDKLKIAYFCWHFPVPSETFVLNELRILRAQGLDVRVFCKHSPNPDFKPDFDIAWERVRDADHLATRLVETGRDVVHAHFVYPTVTDMVWPACERSGVPFTCIAHAQDIFRYGNATKNRIDEFARSPQCKQIFTLSQFHRQYLIDRGVPPAKITINSNCIDPDLFAPGKISDRPQRRTRRVCAVSRFAEKKGLDKLVAAGKLLEADGIGIDIYGYGPLEEALRAAIATSGAANVTLHGPVEGRDSLLEVFRRHDLFACPSVRAPDGDMDGIPTTLMESMAAGLPVLTTPVAGIPDLVVDGVTGFLCEATADSIAAGIRRFYALPEADIAALIEDAEARLRRNHHGGQLVNTLVRFWANETVDLMIVSWNNAAQTGEVIRRLYENTALPFHLIVCDNGSSGQALANLIATQAGHDNMTLILNRENAFVGPGTNLCMAAGTSDYMIYVCGKEGMTIGHGWERMFVTYMDANPAVGQAGTLGYSPSYLHGRDYPGGIRLFDRFRNKAFATDNPDRVFRHVQGGFFVIRRAMTDEIGGFSQDVPHDYTDVEFSFYVESRGWKLGEVPGLMALFNKSRPSLAHRVDETHLALHPPMLTDLPWLDRIARREVCHCNVCGKQARTFLDEQKCPSCGSDPLSRTIFRILAESQSLYRRLPALALNLPLPLASFWRAQFQGVQMEAEEFRAGVAGGRTLPNRTGGMKLALLNDALSDPATRMPMIAEVARLMAPGAVLILRDTTPLDSLIPRVEAAGFRFEGMRRYTSEVVRFSKERVALFVRHDVPVRKEPMARTTPIGY